MFFSGLGPLALCLAPFASQSTSHIPSEDWVAMTMSTMGWGVKSPASQAPVHPLYPGPGRPTAPGTLKGNQPSARDGALDPQESTFQTDQLPVPAQDIPLAKESRGKKRQS